MSVPAVRRIVVGVDGSAESAAAFRWACREASLRGSEVHAVLVREARCHGAANYAVRSLTGPGDDLDTEQMWRSLRSGTETGVPVRTEIIDGLPARVLLAESAGAEMLVLGTASDDPGAVRPAGPVIRACLRRASCPVVVINASREPRPGDERTEGAEEAEPVGAGMREGAMMPLGTAVPVGV